LLDNKDRSGHQTQPFQFAESRRTAIGNAANGGRRLERPAYKRNFLAVNAGRILLRNDAPMRVDLRVTQDRGDAIFKPLGNVVFQPLRLLVNFIPGVLQNIVKE
jgi:hypothetical protein